MIDLPALKARVIAAHAGEAPDRDLAMMVPDLVWELEALRKGLDEALIELAHMHWNYQRDKATSDKIWKLRALLPREVVE